EVLQVSTTALEEFFQFLQCQLRMEALQCFGGPHGELELQDPCAAALWPQFQAWVKPNLGRKEKWMPFHIVLGVHELFMMQNIHHGPVASWDSKRKFLAMFVFRAHCKGDFFLEAQLPHLLLESFWENPLSQFAENGRVTKSMLEYRRRTKQPLQTMAFRCIPARLCEDNDENLVRNIANRTQILLEVAEQVWPIVCDSAKSPEANFEQISREIQRGHGLGDTWAKMLMVSIDIAYPDLGLLSKNCDVGVGAVGGLRRLMPNSGLDAEASSSKLTSLKLVTTAANRCQRPSAASFWQLLSKVERVAHQRYKKMPLIMKQVATIAGALSAATVQVQLCEWRQFLEKNNINNNINNNSSNNHNSSNNTNSNRVSGKRPAPLSTSASNNNTNNNPSVVATSEDEGNLPLKGLETAETPFTPPKREGGNRELELSVPEDVAAAGDIPKCATQLPGARCGNCAATAASAEEPSLQTANEEVEEAPFLPAAGKPERFPRRTAFLQRRAVKEAGQTRAAPCTQATVAIVQDESEFQKAVKRPRLQARSRPKQSTASGDVVPLLEAEEQRHPGSAVDEPAKRKARRKNAKQAEAADVQESSEEITAWQPSPDEVSARRKRRQERR
ncbi:unnamed protein product, partial [Polarella glacialis]